jgi:putative transcriptional regulator
MTVGDRIVEGLTELRDTLRAGVPAEKRFTVRTVEVPQPQRFPPSRIRALRKRLGVSQAVFAELLGVSSVLVQAWEQGVREPSPLARRLLGEVERDPHRWLSLLVSSLSSASLQRKSA